MHLEGPHVIESEGLFVFSWRPSSSSQHAETNGRKCLMQRKKKISCMDSPEITRRTKYLRIFCKEHFYKVFPNSTTQKIAQFLKEV